MKKYLLLLLVIIVLTLTRCGFHLKYAKIHPEGKIPVSTGKVVLGNISIPLVFYKLRPELHLNLKRDLMRLFHRAGIELIIAEIPKKVIKERKEDLWDSRKWFFRPGSFSITKEEYTFELKNAKTAVFVYLLDFKKGYDLANDWIVMDIDFILTDSMSVTSSYRLTGFYDSIIDKLPVLMFVRK